MQLLCLSACRSAALQRPSNCFCNLCSYFLLVCLQIGWAAAPLILLLFAAVTWYTTMMLADCYRYPDPTTGQRNYTYVDAVRNILGEWGFFGG